MLHGSETKPKDHELRRHRRNNRAMIRWICGTDDRDETTPASLLKKLGIEDIT